MSGDSSPDAPWLLHNEQVENISEIPCLHSEVTTGPLAEGQPVQCFSGSCEERSHGPQTLALQSRSPLVQARLGGERDAECPQVHVATRGQMQKGDDRQKKDWRLDDPQGLS